jgi:ribosomal protein L11 methyltransferase
MPKPLSSYRLTVTVSIQNYDTVIFLIHTLGMLGCEEQNVHEGIKLGIYFKDEESALAAFESLKSLMAIPDYSVTKIENQDWNAKWRESMKPARIARGYYVSPLWLPPPKSARHWIKIEPKMAFGTGHHETTRLASQAIIAEKRAFKNKWMLDIGSGSGVLCFVADLCGAGTCIGVELDECCRENMAENFRDNAPRGHINFIMGSTNALNVFKRFSLIVMNMIHTESAPLLVKVASLLGSEGRLIWSGILKDEYREAVTAAEKSGFELISEKTENEWWCGVFGLTDK